MSLILFHAGFGRVLWVQKLGLRPMLNGW